MGVYAWAILAVGLLVIEFFIVRRNRNALSETESDSLKFSMGIIFLAGWCLVNLIRNYPPLMYSFKPGANLVFDLFASLLFLAGIFFVMATFFVSFPTLMRKLKRMNASDQFYALVRKLSNLPAGKDQITFLKSAVAAINSELYPEFYLIECRRKGDQSRIIERGSIEYDVEIDGRPHGRKYSEEDFKWNLYQTRCERRRNMTVVVKDDDKTVYRMMFYFRHPRLGFLYRENHELIESVLQSRIDSLNEVNSRENKILVSSRSNRLYEMISGEYDISEYLKKISPVIAETIDFDYISIAVLDSAVQNMHRYTYANVGGALMEKGICYPLKQTITQKAAQEKQMMISNSLETDFYRDDYHLYKSGFSSRLVYPLIGDDRAVRGVLILAAVKPGAFNKVADNELDFLNKPLCRMISFNTVSNLMKTLKKQVVSSFNLTFGLEENGVKESFYDHSARILSETLPATMCRIWGLDTSGTRLNPMGYYNLHDTPGRNYRHPDPVGLELLPRHRRAIEMGKALIINQSHEESRMDKPELEALGLPGMKSAILAPMKLSDRVLGIISVGEVRNWERRSLGTQELLYSQIISTIAALVFDLAQKSVRLDEYLRNAARTELGSQLYHTFREMPTKMASPLSAILGAAEIISKKVPREATELTRYNDMIIRSANTLMNEIRVFDELKKELGGKIS